MAAVAHFYASSLLPSVVQGPLWHIGLRKLLPPKHMELSANVKSGRHHLGLKARVSHPSLIVLAATKGSAKSGQSDERIPSWAKADSDELPPWARDEGKVSTSKPAFEVPFYVYLLGSAITAIAAIGSIFEYINQNPVFGILSSDSVFYAPLLGFFAFTGIPTSAFLWFRSVQSANKEAEDQDRRDGYF